MKKSEFERLNRKLSKNNEKLFANPRNAAAGSIRTLVLNKERNLHFFAYQLFEGESYLLSDQLTCLKRLEKLGFKVSPDYKLFEKIEEVNEFVKNQEKKRENLDFESDGTVIKVNDYSLYSKLGQTNKFPH